MGAKASTNSNAHNNGAGAGVDDNNVRIILSGNMSQRSLHNGGRARTVSSTSPQTSRRSSTSRYPVHGYSHESSNSRHDRYRARSVHFERRSVSSDEEDSEEEASGSSSNMYSSITARQTSALRAFLAHSVLTTGLKCPLCKQMSNDADQFQAHVIKCLQKPRLTYNVDRVVETREEECVICFEDFVSGELIARLPCLCIYHKHCIDDWFRRNRTCPQHPNAIDASDFEAESMLVDQESNDAPASEPEPSTPVASTSASTDYPLTSNVTVPIAKPILSNSVCNPESCNIDVE